MKNQKTRALARLKASESASKRREPGSVVIQFRDPVHKVPFWRFARDADYTTVYQDSVALQETGGMFVVFTVTERGTMKRYFNPEDIATAVVVPPINSDTSEG